jgi:actin-like ATPase involved in cell morphogenesis
MQPNRAPGVIAIDFGTTKTSVAWMKPGVSNPALIKLSPSINVNKCTATSIETAFRCDENGDIEEFGESAYLWKSKFSSRTYYNFKPELTDPENTEAYELSKKWLGLVFKLIKKSMNSDDLDNYQFVIGHPVKWTLNSQQKLLQIAKEAGFTKIKSMREPIGAALYLQWAELQKIPSGRSLIIDFGGGTIDFILMEIDGVRVRTIRAGGDDRLGGRNIDELIYEHLTARYKFQNDESNAMEVDLMLASRYLKEQLSDKPHETYFSTNISMQAIALENKDLTLICNPVFESIETKLLGFLNDQDDPVGVQDISSVILCGGSTKLLGFKTFIDKIFHDKIYDYSVDSREIIVKGLTRVESVLEKDTDDNAHKEFVRQIEILIYDISEKSSTLFGETHVKEVYDKIVENLLKKYGESLGSSEEINKDFAKCMLNEMSLKVLSELSTSVSSYKESIRDLMSMPHRIIRDVFGRDLTLPASVIDKVYKQDINPDYFYERMNDDELEWYEYPLLIILLPFFYPIYYILTSKKGRFLDTLSYSVKRYFQYSPPKKKSKLLAKGSFSYQIIEQVKADYPELILIPHFNHYKEYDEGKQKILNKLLSQKDVDRYKKTIDQLWKSYLNNFNLGE